MTVAIIFIGVCILCLWGLFFWNDVGEPTLGISTIIVSLSIAATVIVGITYSMWLEPRIEYADCVVEHQDINKCAVLMPEKDGE